MNKTFTEILKKSDIAAAKIDFKDQLQILGGNAAKCNEFVGSLGNVASVLVQNPTIAEQANISEQIVKLFVEITSFVKSQLGFKNIDTDKIFIENPKFTTFSTSYKQLKTEINVVKLNSSGSYEYFMNSVDELASFFVLMVQTSKEASRKKPNLCC